MFFLLVLIKLYCAQTIKYLYLGTTNCDAVGNEAYLDYKITSGNYICSSKIPEIDPKKPQGFSPNKIDYLAVVLLQHNSYPGLENLFSFPNVLIAKLYSEDDEATLYIDAQTQLTGQYYMMNHIVVLDGIKLNIENRASIYLTINLLELRETLAIVNIQKIEATQLYIFVDKDMVINDFLDQYKSSSIFFEGNGAVTIYDKYQILHQKKVFLIETNLEYTGKDNYGIDRLTYTGVEKVKKTYPDDPLMEISMVFLKINSNLTLSEFIEADVTNLFIESVDVNSKIFTLTIDPQSPIYLPISTIFNTRINSDRKIKYDEGRSFSTNILVDISCFSGKTKDDTRLSTFYQIYSQEKKAYAYIFRHDDIKIELNNAFLQYPFKGFVTSHTDIAIQSTHLEGITELNDLNLLCSDSNCQMDAFLVTGGTGRLLNKNSAEIKAEYFEVQKQGNKIIYQPMKANVTDYNEILYLYSTDEIELKHFENDEKDKTNYKLLYDIFANTLTIGDNINITFDCNLHLKNDLIVPQNSNIVDSKESGIKVISSSDSITLDKISSSYSKQFNKIYFYYDNLINKKLVVNGLGSQTDKLNTLCIMFLGKSNVIENLFLEKIEACKGVHIEFYIENVYVEENTIKVDKDTLSINPSFSSKDIIEFGTYTDENSEMFYFTTKRRKTQIFNSQFSKLYLEGNFVLPNIKVSKTLYIKGCIYYSDNSVINTHDLIIDITDTALTTPKFNVDNAIFTSRIDDFTLISNIHSPKIVISGIDSNQNITIKENLIKLNKNNEYYTLDTTNHDKVILYIPHSEVSSTLLNEQGNNVELNVEDTKQKNRAIDFNIITNNDSDSSKESILRFKISDTISQEKPEFIGTFGYAFDSALNGRVVYKEGESGQEKDEAPDYFPIKMVEIEPFDVETTPIPIPSSSEDEESVSPTSIITPAQTSTPTPAPTKIPTPLQTPVPTPAKTPAPTLTPTPEPTKKSGGNGSGSSDNEKYDLKTSSVLLGDFEIQTVYIGESSIVNFKPGYLFMRSARKLIGHLVPPPNFIHSAVWVGPENANDTTLGAVFVYGKYFARENDSTFLHKDGARSYIMSLAEFKENFDVANIVKLHPKRKMNHFEFMEEVKNSGIWTAKDYNWPTNNCQHFVSSCINILRAVREFPSKNDWLDIPQSIIDTLKKNELEA